MTNGLETFASLFFTVTHVVYLLLLNTFILFLNKLHKDEKHQTRVSLSLELISDAYLTANWLNNRLKSSGIVTCVGDYRFQVRFAVR